MQQKPGDFTRALFLVIEVQEVLVLIGWLSVLVVLVSHTSIGCLSLKHSD